MNDSESSLASGACRLTLTNEAGSPALACALARNFGAQLGFDAEALDRIELGIEEAVSNVVRHAFARDELHDFDVTFQRSGLGLEILIHDQGQPFDPAHIPDYDPDLSLVERPDTGLGMRLIRRAFDQVAYHNLGHAGKQMRLVKFGELIPIGERELPPSHQPKEAEAVSDIRLMRPDEALAVARLVHEAYGYSYPYEHIYFPERIVELNVSGALCSAVAVTPSGHIAGHAALMGDEHHSDRAELGIVVTGMAYRGQGVAQRIGEFLLAEARRRGLRLLYSNAVTAHPYTQLFMHKLGFAECALLPGHAPASLRFRKVVDELPQRESCMLMVNFIDPTCRSQREAAVPDKHRETLAALYTHLDIPFHALSRPVDTAALPEHTRVHSSIHTGLELALLRVTEWGRDGVDSLRARVAQLRRDRTAVIELQLPLADPHTALWMPNIEALGFRFGGVSPGADGSEDHLLLEFVGDPGFNYAALNIASETGKQLRKHMAEPSE